MILITKSKLKKKVVVMKQVIELLGKTVKLYIQRMVISLKNKERSQKFYCL